MGAVLDRRHSAIAHLQHVSIVPVAGTRKWPQWLVQIDDVRHWGRPVVSLVVRREAVPDVSGRTPQIRTVLCPQPRLRRTPLAHGKDDRPAARAKRISHDCISFLSAAVAGAAPIIFKVIDAPTGIGESILVFVALATGTSSASQSSGVGIDAKF